MKISFNTRLKSADTILGTNGFGYATNCMLDTLRSLGHEVKVNDPTAPVGLVFDQAPHAKWFDTDQYRIHYMPWESTKLPDKWDNMLNHADEVWTPSDLIADWLPAAGVKKPVYEYFHGIEPEWSLKERTRSGPIKFLLLGMEGTRKNGWQALNYIRSAFNGTDVDYQVTAKMVNSSWNGIENIGRVRYINETYSFSQLQELFYSHDYLVHISSGEGFGFPPLQALASGMPTILLPEWAPYRDFTDPRLHVEAKMVKSPWPEIHPGYVFRPDKESVIETLRTAATEYDSLHNFANEQSPLIHAAFNWKAVTEPVFKNLENRLEKFA